MNAKTIGAIIIGIIVIGGGWYFYASSPNDEAAEMPVVQTGTIATSTAVVSTDTGPITISYTDQGFMPANVTVTEGATVIFENQSGSKMWVAANAHPAHTGYDGTSKSAHCVAGFTGEKPFDECTAVEKGGTYSFVFNKAGSWPYHNHAGAEDGGTITVLASSATTTVDVTR